MLAGKLGATPLRKPRRGYSGSTGSRPPTSCTWTGWTPSASACAIRSRCDEHNCACDHGVRHMVPGRLQDCRTDETLMTMPRVPGVQFVVDLDAELRVRR